MARKANGNHGGEERPKGKPRGKPFARGFDPRRYLFTKLDCQNGYHNAPQWVRNRIRGLYKGGQLGGPFLPVDGEYPDTDIPF